MARALDMFVVEGIHTTIPLHKRIMADPDFRAGQRPTPSSWNASWRGRKRLRSSLCQIFLASFHVSTPSSMSPLCLSLRIAHRELLNLRANWQPVESSSSSTATRMATFAPC